MVHGAFTHVADEQRHAVAEWPFGMPGFAGAQMGAAPAGNGVTTRSITITNPRIRVVSPGGANTAGYMGIRGVRVAGPLPQPFTIEVLGRARAPTPRPAPPRPAAR